jgi:hypothetical protein
MNSNHSSDEVGPDQPGKTQGTSEQTSLTVKLLAGTWIIENALGSSVGSAEDRASAVDLARQAAGGEKASSISVLSADGTVEEVINL